ncbi:MAG TPA: hypothetical protein VJO32_17780 [Ktedonobacteraceae bacterium]|nr:hypothetical protein [Ktedonobacteraceae bacterium]
MTEQELEQLLQDLKRFDDAYDELDAQMKFLIWPEWGAVRDQRDVVGEAYIAISDRLSTEGYRVRWNKETQRYDATSVVKLETRGLSINEKS